MRCLALDVRFGSKADIWATVRNVRFTPKADILRGGVNVR